MIGRSPTRADPTVRVVMRYDYDMLGRRMPPGAWTRASGWISPTWPESRARLGQPRPHPRTEYDAAATARCADLSGPTLVENPACPMLDRATVYGEGQPDERAAEPARARADDLRRAGRSSTRGTTSRATRLAPANASRPTTGEHWTGPPSEGKLEAEEFTSRSWFDALNRAIQVVPPHSSRTR